MNSLNTTSKYCNVYLETLDHYKENDNREKLKDINNPKISNINDRVILFPISPSECMFSNDTSSVSINLLVAGETSVGLSKKLATWSITAMFPDPTTNKNLPYIATTTIDDKTFIPDPYTYYCKTIYTWQKEQTPLVFRLKTWGEYYYCQVKKFDFGRQDYSGWVYANIDFVEFKSASLYNGESNAEYSTDYPSDYYYADSNDDIINLCIKLYGTSDAYRYFMNLNSMKNIKITPHAQYKVR